MGAIDNARMAWRQAGAPARLIWVNVAVFILLRLSVIAGLLAGVADPMPAVLRTVELPSNLRALALAPWTVVTYMFAQYDALHIIFNMLWLYWFGQVMLYRCTPAQLVTLYLYGGLAGALMFLSAYNTLPVFNGSTGMLIGASASVMAIVTATAILMPDFRMRLLFIGDVKLKWIAVATIILVLLGATGSNMGGEAAHLGGIAAGAAFAVRLRGGRDITAPAIRLFRRLGSATRRAGAGTAPGPQPSQRAPHIDEPDRRRLDEILDKIKRSGYSALSPEERKTLFEVSRKIK